MPKRVQWLFPSGSSINGSGRTAGSNRQSRSKKRTMELMNNIADNLIIREADPADASDLLTYLRQVGGESDNLLFDQSGVPMTLEQEERYLADLKHAERQAMFMALLDDRIVGTGQIIAFGRDRISHRASLAISVLKVYWGQGVGSRLMERLIDFAKQVGVEVITLEVRADNERGIRLYEKFGFQDFGRLEHFFKVRGRYYAARYMVLDLQA